MTGSKKVSADAPTDPRISVDLTPAVGMNVTYFSDNGEDGLHAVIAGINADGSANLTVFNRNGTTTAVESVLAQDEVAVDAKGIGDGYYVMPA